MKKRNIVFVILFLLLVIAWFGRYISLNRYYESISAKTERLVYGIGDTVPFEDDRMGSWAQANGYSLRVDRFEIVDSQTFIDTVGFIPSEHYYPCEKVGVVYITLSNKDSNADGVMLTDLSLCGIDQILHLNWDLLFAANPTLEGNTGISLAQGTEYSLVLPFGMFEAYFSTTTWNDFENYELFLELTIYPHEKMIKVQ